MFVVFNQDVAALALNSIIDMCFDRFDCYQLLLILLTIHNAIFLLQLDSIEAKRGARREQRFNELNDKELISLLQAEPLETCGSRPGFKVIKDTNDSLEKNNVTEYESDDVQRVQLGEFPSFGFVWPITHSNGRSQFFASLGNECGAVLVGKRSVLASTTCINHLTVNNKTELVVQFGKIKGHKKDPRNQYKIERVCTDKRMCFNGFIHDGYSMALLKLNRDVEYNDRVQPVCLPFALDAKYLRSRDDLYYAIGRGGGKVPLGNPIFKIKLKHSSCPSPSFNRNNKQHPTIDCYQFEPSKVCVTQSGGGVYYERDKGKQFLAGPISARLYGDDCEDANLIHTLDVNKLERLRDSLHVMLTEEPKCYSILDQDSTSLSNLPACSHEDDTK